MVLLFNTRSIAITFALLVELIVHPKHLKHDMYEDFH